MNQTWRTRLCRTLTGKQTAELLANLSSSEKQKFDALRIAKRQQEFIVSRNLMRCALSHHFDLPQAHWRFQERAKNSPQLLNPPKNPLHLSISHSHDWVLLAFSQKPLGIDIEKQKTLLAMQKIAQKVFTPEECKALLKLKSQAAQDRFYQLWTRKEATIKISKQLNKPQYLYSNQSWQIQSMHSAFSTFDDHTASIVAELPIDQFTHFELSLNEKIAKLDF